MNWILDSFVPALGTHVIEKYITLIKIGRVGGGEVEF